MRREDALWIAKKAGEVGRAAAAAIERLTADNDRLTATVKAREDEILTHSEAFYEATKLLSEEREKNERLRELLAEMVEVHEDPCRLDHHGYCQEHFLDDVNDGGCRVANAKTALQEVPR